ncbi:MAG: 50S ribosomal protein L31 [Anaerolineaceae bacterium]|nr:50S ribosomal protein L31 [Anaerolineaceae bacterium]
MKKDTHPKYYQNATVTCASCGATWQTGSTKEDLRTEVCSNCHPFFTGQLQRILDVEGQVDRFYKRLQARESYIEEKRRKVDEKTSPNRPIDELDLSKRSIEALAKAGVVTIGEALERLEAGEAGLLDIEGFGRKSLIDLKKQIRQMGYTIPEAADTTA